MRSPAPRHAGDRCHVSFADRDYAGWLRMFPSDFIDHLTRRGVLADAPILGAAPMAGRGSADVDWLGLTKLTASGFADELAAFYGCVRVQRSDLVEGASPVARCRRVSCGSGGCFRLRTVPERWHWRWRRRPSARRSVRWSWPCAGRSPSRLLPATTSMRRWPPCSTASNRVPRRLPRSPSRTTIWMICATSHVGLPWCARSTICSGSRSSSVPPTCISSPSAMRCRCVFASTGFYETSRRLP